MKRFSLLLCLAGLLVAGCLQAVDPVVYVPSVPSTVAVAGAVERHAVVFGLDRVDAASYGGWAGECPGTLLDALRMKALLESRGYSAVLLTNNLATASRVVSACVAQCAGLRPGDKFYVYGSSHGGQVVDLNGDEAGGKDSTICLWDGQFTDDLVWKMLLRVPEGVEVDLVTDCCNAGTNYRGPHDYVRVFRASDRGRRGDLRCSFTHMGGCGDGLSSYGGEDGGEFTNALLATGPGALTRIGWFNAAARRMPRNQVPVYSELGTSVQHREAMR